MNSPTSQKPVISELQANAAVHLAGQQAEQDAAANGISPTDAETLLDAATGLTVKGVTFPPLHPGYILLLGKLDKLAGENPLLNAGNGKLASAYLIGKPREARELLRAGNVEAFSDAVEAFTEPFDVSDILRIDAWIRGEFARLNGAEDEAPKK